MTQGASSQLSLFLTALFEMTALHTLLVLLQVQSQRINILLKPKRLHGPEQVLPVDRFALLLLAASLFGTFAARSTTFRLTSVAFTTLLSTDRHRKA